MSVSIGLVANLYNEANALPSWLECHLPYFNDIRILHAGPQGALSNDGTLEILEQHKIPVEFCAIDDGFGVVRSKAIHMSPCEYVMLLDIDERFYPEQFYKSCYGSPTPQHEVDEILRGYNFYNGNIPNWNDIEKLGANLVVENTGIYNQGEMLRFLLNEHKPDAICSIRRHWHDLEMLRPTQNWFVEPDWQMRIVRNSPNIRFDSATKMHERLVGANHVIRADMLHGPFFEHFHFTYKRMEEKQRAHDIAIYDAIHEGKTPPKE